MSYTKYYHQEIARNMQKGVLGHDIAAGRSVNEAANGLQINTPIGILRQKDG